MYEISGVVYSSGWRHKKRTKRTIFIRIEKYYLRITLFENPLIKYFELNIEEQQMLEFEVAKLTPVKSFTRLNIGYLFAMQHGAKVIFDGDFK